jgi:translocator protein
MGAEQLKRWLGLVVWVMLSLAAGAFGSRFEPGAWYAALEKPAWTPPSSVFGPVWTVLYVLMGVAAWLVWERRGDAARGALTLFVVQLLFNAAWSWLFFGLQSPGMALMGIIVLWVLIAATALVFWRARAVAGTLLLPYLAWVTFATALNFEIWRLNG